MRTENHDLLPGLWITTNIMTFMDGRQSNHGWMISEDQKDVAS